MRAAGAFNWVVEEEPNMRGLGALDNDGAPASEDETLDCWPNPVDSFCKFEVLNVLFIIKLFLKDKCK
jgi:hypothetical protein